MKCVFLKSNIFSLADNRFIVKIRSSAFLLLLLFLDCWISKMNNYVSILNVINNNNAEKNADVVIRI